MSKKRKVIEEVKIPWYKQVQKSTWIMAAIITAMVLAAAGIIIYENADTYSKINYSKTVKLGQYEGLKGTLEVPEITDEDVQAEIQQRLDEAGTTETVTEGKVKDGDTIVLDYEGKIDGEAFEGGTAEDQTLEIGSGTFIPGFEEALVGKKIGKSYTIDVTFPEDYDSEELAGQDAQFDVTIKSKEQKNNPEYDVAFIKKDSKYDNKKDYEKSIKKELQKDAKEQAEDELKETLWSEVLDNTKIKKYPEDLMEEEIQIQKDQYEQMASQYGMSVEQMGITEDQYKDFAKDSLKEKLTMHAISKEANVKVKGSDEKDFYKEILEDSEMNEKEFEEAAGMTVEEYVAANHYESYMLREKILDYVYDNAKIKTK